MASTVQVVKPRVRRGHMVLGAQNKAICPLRDGILAAALVFGCFCASAAWIYFQAWKNEVAHHGDLVTMAARRAAESLDATVLEMDHPPPPGAGAAVMERLEAIDAERSPVSRVTVLKAHEDRFHILFDTAEAESRNWLLPPEKARIVAPDEADVVADIIASGREKHYVREDGSSKAYVPIRIDSGPVLGVATAESSADSLQAGLAAVRLAVWSALVGGIGLAAAACAGVYSLRWKARKVLDEIAMSERADSLVLETLGQVSYEMDLDSKATRWRGDLAGVLGLSPSDLATEEDWMARIHKADRDDYESGRAQQGQKVGRYSIEYRVRRKDGSYVWVMDRGCYMPGEEDMPPTAMGVVLDMTASREAEQRLRDVVDAAGEYIWEVNAEGQYVYLSDRVQEVLGRTPAEMLGRTPFEFIPPEDGEDTLNSSNVLVEKRSAFRDFEHRILHADGRAIWLSVNGVPTYDANGEWSGYRGAGMEITARKEAEQALIREKEAANAAVRAKSQFLAMMSHEIRTPLNSVLGFSDLLSVTPLNSEQREQLELIRKSGDALLELLNDILDFSRIESDGLALNVNDVDLSVLLQDVMSLYRPTAEQKQIALHLELDPGVPAILRTDKARLRQILLNLVGNAVKFTEEGSVTVRAKVMQILPDGRTSTKIEVVDTGIGIPEDKKDLLFHPFSQVDSSATRKFGGTGLGLAICRRLADLLGGRVGLTESGPDGSNFYLELNAMESDGREIAASVEAFRDRSGSGRLQDGSRRILVVEDNRVNRLLIRKMLASFGVASEEAENGAECLEKHAAQSFGLIFMDVQMPVLDGLEASRNIRRQEHASPGSGRTTIIALTADAMIGDRERCLAAGMDDYLSKPIRTEALELILERYGILKTDIE